MFRFHLVRACCISFLIVFFLSAFIAAQVENATISGQVVDSSGLRIAGARIYLVDIDRGTNTSTATDNSGLYRFPSVHPGRYRIQVSAPGFRVIDITGVTVNVQDHLEQNVKLVVGSVSESVTVEGGIPLIDTESATVSTVIDRQFADNLPLNGRSFQTLIELTPGVVLTASNSADNGQFSVSGQRPSSNYWTVDGVSANIGSSAGGNPGNGMGGTVAALSVLGGTNSLVSVDALQEFRIQTSTYAPEFGRTPGGQISVVTRSGTNYWHGTLFEYLRNNAFDANNWFADHATLPKPMERQNDFGGVFGGPVSKDRTFFFFSYEGLRLRLPRVELTDVPCDSTCADFGDARNTAVQGMRPFLNAFPRPNGPEVFGTAGNPSGAAEFDASYSNPATLNAYSLRLDHRFQRSLNAFARYNYSPSEFSVRGGSNGLDALSVVQPLRVNVQTATLGATWLIRSGATNDTRLNYSRADGLSEYTVDDFGGAAPLSSVPFPNPFTSKIAAFTLVIESLGNSVGGAGGYINLGPAGRNVQRQINFVDNLSGTKGAHNLKFGVDFRRLTPVYDPAAYSQFPIFLNMPSAMAGNSAFAFIDASRAVTPLFRDLAAFGQDTWRVSPQLTLTYGLRWDLESAPSTLNGPRIPAVSGFNLLDFSKLALAAPGTPPFHTTFGNVAPRLGVAYQLNRNPAKDLVFRGGVGIFYDLVSSETGNLIGGGYPPFGSFTTLVGKTFPYSPAQSTPAPIPVSGSLSQLYAYNPDLKQPYTWEWNLAIQQALGTNQSISLTYVGAAGRKLLQSFGVTNPPTNVNLSGFLIDNTAASDYDALQVQFDRHLTHGLQALASYTWAHSIDDGSAGSFGIISNVGVPGIRNVNRGPSDFDIRNTASLALTYSLPKPSANLIANKILGGWSVENLVLVRSATPVDITDNNFFESFDGGTTADVRPDVIVGRPLYLYGSQYPGGKAFDAAGFKDPPSDPNTGNPVRQGTTPRNFLRGFGAIQWDIAMHRDFSIHDSLAIQFRAEIFNVVNHPNFGAPDGAFGTNSFGVSNETLAQSFTGRGGAGSGALNPLYQIGGPRSIQLALKLQF